MKSQLIRRALDPLNSAGPPIGPLSFIYGGKRNGQTQFPGFAVQLHAGTRLWQLVFILDALSTLDDGYSGWHVGRFSWFSARAVGMCHDVLSEPSIDKIIRLSETCRLNHRRGSLRARWPSQHVFDPESDIEDIKRITDDRVNTTLNSYPVVCLGSVYI
ncbi:hypothetical protein QTP88_008132 [Uroleucon formosanum]